MASFREFNFHREKWSPYLMDVFNCLHNMPEPGWQEIMTTSFLKDNLERLGYETITYHDCTGVLGVRGNGSFTVALRADMDALCHQTDTGQRMIHSCGHDAHMAMVLTAAAALMELPLPAGTRVKIIFQPAEEKGEGALRLVEKGAVDDVSFLFGVHLRPGQELPGGQASPAILNGAAYLINGEIQGVSAHGARPHLGVNVIEVAAALVQMLHALRWDPLQPASIKMTRINAGTEAGNIIPDRAIFTLDLRAQTNQQLKELVQKVESVASNVAAAYGAVITLTRGIDMPAAEVSKEARDIMARAITDTVGPENLAPPILTPGAEDFHFYTRLRPHIKATMLGLGCDLYPGLHHPGMQFERAYLLDGAEILARAVWYACTET
ncbi:M20 peptidase aminoacylase family protein [Desulfofundulus salinus]|uniref:Amidohydrolase n=1 Tax=Desulfofundulus salinus TaxID=2419843 RepID=A0A494WZI3_9FIRM|nr:M20 peptidase aminoacylase family protein [Desulfofundulus salinum]RKO67762.1 amidohydrolase [Desulfofundulus salinum]